MRMQPDHPSHRHRRHGRFGNMPDGFHRHDERECRHGHRRGDHDEHGGRHPWREFGPGRWRHRGEDHDGEHGGRHGGRRRIFDGGELRLVLLKLIADQPRHGYDLIRAIEELTGGAYAPSPGIVYPTLSILADLGHIEESEASGARKAFAATQAGRDELEAQAATVKALFERLSALAVTREHLDSAPVRRAMENLKSALRNRLGATDVAKNTPHDVAAILDEAAQKIERL